MLRYAITPIAFFALVGCEAPHHNVLNQTPVQTQQSSCVGSIQLSDLLASKLDPIKAPVLLSGALGQTGKGKLCQGQVYQSHGGARVTLYRAWNSTNPNSQFGQWWSFSRPRGEISQYRADYEICYQWSPLDRMMKCQLKPGTKIVVGTGQSAKCSEYLTYPASASLQVYLAHAQDVLMNCHQFTAHFRWDALRP
ncbi:MAG: hypothetical protein CENE_03458 [Candidatus Celerinatantimonas neptuna]|nr:MAG: hypothetical protein CENE_03458 [Candidatus Celerinatantimonas neptuna]